MKKSHVALGLTFCACSLVLAGNVLAIPAREALDTQEELAEQPTGKNSGTKDCHLFLVKRDFTVQETSMEAGEPIDTFHLFITDGDGKIVKNAQVVATITDQQGRQQLGRAVPFKGGYMLAIDHLAAGQYQVAVEIVTKGGLLTDLFRFDKG